MMSDKECIIKIEDIARDYSADTGDTHWADWYMEKIIDVIEEYNRTNIFRQPFIN